MHRNNGCTNAPQCYIVHTLWLSASAGKEEAVDTLAYDQILSLEKLTRVLKYAIPAPCITGLAQRPTGDFGRANPVPAGGK